MTPSDYRPLSSVLGEVREAVDERRAPELWRAGPGELGGLELGPGRIVLLGGAPGSGKTALSLQATVDILRTHSGDERALVANVEMTPEALVERQLARLSGVDLDRIRRRALDPGDAEPFERAVATLRQLGDRLGFMLGPFTLERLGRTADEMGARLLVVDYVQRFSGAGGAREDRQVAAEVMQSLRRAADAGAAVLALAALSRTRDHRGSGYEVGDPLAAFRDSSELEYGADEAYVLEPATAENGMVATLRHAKNRHGRLCDIRLRFDGRRQAFENPILPAGLSGKAAP
jgi:replicative DNA helicase